MRDITSCAQHPGCQCANCKRPIVSDFRPRQVVMQDEPLDSGGFDMSQAGADGYGWRRAGWGKVDPTWAREQSFITLSATLRRLT